MMFARATLIICAFFFMMPTTLGAAIGKPNFQTRDTEELNMPLRRSAVDTRKTGAIWIGRAYQHTREEEVEAPQHAPAPAVRDEGMEVHRVARTKGAVWQGNEHEDTQEKVRRKASTNAANKRRAPVPTPLNSVISQRFEHEEANYHRREVNPGTSDYQKARRGAEKGVKAAIWRNNVHEEANKTRVRLPSSLSVIRKHFHPESSIVMQISILSLSVVLPVLASFVTAVPVTGLAPAEVIIQRRSPSGNIWKDNVHEEVRKARSDEKSSPISL
ncbi:hypothetical protein J3A83DRAFT_4375003 [Scleroderma citrinum]